MERKYLIAAAVVGLLLLLGLAWRAHAAKKEGLALGLGHKGAAPGHGRGLPKKQVRFNPVVKVDPAMYAAPTAPTAPTAPLLPPLVSPLDPVALGAVWNPTIVQTVNKI